MVVKVCACQHDGDSRKFFFRAPANSNIKKQDRVLCSTRYGPYPATVLSETNLSDEEIAYRILLEMNGATHPLKPIIGVYRFEEFSYED